MLQGLTLCLAAAEAASGMHASLRPRAAFQSSLEIFNIDQIVLN